jgi:hypothetical protein
MEPMSATVADPRTGVAWLSNPLASRTPSVVPWPASGHPALADGSRLSKTDGAVIVVSETNQPMGTSAGATYWTENVRPSNVVDTSPALAAEPEATVADITSISDFLYHFSSPWPGDVAAGAAYEGRLPYPAVYSH